MSVPKTTKYRNKMYVFYKICNTRAQAVKDVNRQQSHTSVKGIKLVAKLSTPFIGVANTPKLQSKRNMGGEM